MQGEFTGSCIDLLQLATEMLLNLKKYAVLSRLHHSMVLAMTGINREMVPKICIYILPCVQAMHTTYRSRPVMRPWINDAVFVARHQCRRRLYNSGKVCVLVVLVTWKLLSTVLYSSVSVVCVLIAVAGVV